MPIFPGVPKGWTARWFQDLESLDCCISLLSEDGKEYSQSFPQWTLIDTDLEWFWDNLAKQAQVTLNWGRER